MIITLNARQTIKVNRFGKRLLLYDLCYKKTDEDDNYPHEEIGYEFKLFDLLLKDNAQKYNADARDHGDLAADNLANVNTQA